MVGIINCLLTQTQVVDCLLLVSMLSNNFSDTALIYLVGRAFCMPVIKGMIASFLYFSELSCSSFFFPLEHLFEKLCRRLI